MPDAEITVSSQGMSVVCPAGWRDESMLVITSERPESSGITPNLVITRQRLPDDLPTDRIARLQEFVDRQMRLSLADFKEVSERRVSPG